MKAVAVEPIVLALLLVPGAGGGCGGWRARRRGTPRPVRFSGPRQPVGGRLGMGIQRRPQRLSGRGPSSPRGAAAPRRTNRSEACQAREKAGQASTEAHGFISNWFLMQMHRADEAAKIVIVHMAVEASCDVLGNRTRVAFPHSGTPDESYFDLHAAVDEDHSQIGRDYLRALSPARFPELMTVCDRAWDQLELAHDRIAAHILR